MRGIICTLTVTILMAMALVSPAQAFNSYSANETSLMIWDSTEMETSYPFEDVRFYSDYTNSTSGSPISGSCRIRYTEAGEWSNWLSMGFISADSNYQLPAQFAYSGWHSFEVE